MSQSDQEQSFRQAQAIEARRQLPPLDGIAFQVANCLLDAFPTAIPEGDLDHTAVAQRAAMQRLSMEDRHQDRPIQFGVRAARQALNDAYGVVRAQQG